MNLSLSAMIWDAIYLLHLVGFAVLWLLGLHKNSRFARVSEVIEHVMVHRATRIAIITVWWWLGWHFFSD